LSSLFISLSGISRKLRGALDLSKTLLKKIVRRGTVRTKERRDCEGDYAVDKTLHLTLTLRI
ncbi:hypothetical protein N8476_02080, partial [Akkermansiaceae bacterium]|nr:hypothetical protein [Akkermansiaceae bacterium]